MTVSMPFKIPLAFGDQLIIWYDILQTKRMRYIFFGFEFLFILYLAS